MKNLLKYEKTTDYCQGHRAGSGAYLEKIKDQDLGLRPRQKTRQGDAVPCTPFQEARFISRRRRKIKRYFIKGFQGTSPLAGLGGAQGLHPRVS
jgi:hypothetical protein